MYEAGAKLLCGRVRGSVRAVQRLGQLSRWLVSRQQAGGVPLQLVSAGPGGLEQAQCLERVAATGDDCQQAKQMIEDGAVLRDPLAAFETLDQCDAEVTEE